MFPQILFIGPFNMSRYRQVNCRGITDRTSTHEHECVNQQSSKERNSNELEKYENYLSEERS